MKRIIQKPLRFVSLLAAFFLLGSTSSEAVGFHPQSPLKDPQVAAWIAAAESYWGTDASPTCPEGIYSEAIDPANRGLDDKSGRTETVAWANAQSCYLGYSSFWYPSSLSIRSPVSWGRRMCAVTIHEYGHLLGLDHVEDPNNIMYAYMDSFSTPQCNSLYPYDNAFANVKKRIPHLQPDTYVKRKKSGISLEVSIVNIEDAEATNLNVCLQWGKKLQMVGLGKQREICFRQMTLPVGEDMDNKVVFKRKGKKKQKVVITLLYSNKSKPIKKTILL